MPQFCAVPMPTIVYAGPATKEEFDRIQLKETVHDWQPGRASTLREDGQQWERQCHSKTLGNFEQDGVTVVFQWFDERPIAAEKGE